MKEILKICMITSFYPPYNFGGDGIFVHQLANELAERGHQVDVFHCIDSFKLLSTDFAKGDPVNHPRVKITGLKSSVSFFSPLLTQQTGRIGLKKELINALKNNYYDVIHYHNISLIGVTALSYGSSNTVKLYTMHEHWLICPMHNLWKFNREICTKKTCTLCQIAGGVPPQLWRHTNLLNKMIEYVDVFISPSQFTKMKHLADGLKIDVRHIPNFIKIPRATNDTKSLNQVPYFLFAGRLEKIKGLQTLLPIFRNNNHYNLLIAGDGKYKEELTKMAGDNPNIKFLGKLERGELENLYREAIAVIIPSICYETFGIVAIEALSLKTPVIVRNLGALPEIVQKSGGGYIYDNEQELVELLDRLASNPSLRNELGEKGFAGFLKYWNAEVYLEQYFELIEDVIENKKIKK